MPIKAFFDLFKRPIPRRDVLKGGLAATLLGGGMAGKEALKTATQAGDPKAKYMLRHIIEQTGLNPSGTRKGQLESLEQILRGGSDNPVKWQPGEHVGGTRRVQHRYDPVTDEYVPLHELDPVEYENMGDFVSSHLEDQLQTNRYKRQGEAIHQVLGKEAADLHARGELKLHDAHRYEGLANDPYYYESPFDPETLERYDLDAGGTDEDLNFSSLLSKAQRSAIEGGLPENLRPMIGQTDMYGNTELDNIKTLSDAAYRDPARFIGTTAQEGTAHFNPQMRQAVLNRYALGTKMGDDAAKRLLGQLGEMKRYAEVEADLARMGIHDTNMDIPPATREELQGFISTLNSSIEAVRRQGILGQDVDPSIIKGWLGQNTPSRYLEVEEAANIAQRAWVDPKSTFGRTNSQLQTLRAHDRNMIQTRELGKIPEWVYDQLSPPSYMETREGARINWPTTESMRQDSLSGMEKGTPFPEGTVRVTPDEKRKSLKDVLGGVR